MSTLERIDYFDGQTALTGWLARPSRKPIGIFHSYSGVGHGFANPASPANGGTISYDPSADRQSWAAMLGLFDEVFG